MADFLGVFYGGPVTGQTLTVYPDPALANDKHFPKRPAMWQEFRKPIIYPSLQPSGRVGLHRYRLNGQLPDGSWIYVFDHYGESQSNVVHHTCGGRDKVDACQPDLVVVRASNSFLYGATRDARESTTRR